MKLSRLNKKTIIIVTIIVIITAIWFVLSKPHNQKYNLVQVKKGTMTQIVSVTGNVTSTNNVDLSFQNSGIISSVYKQEGDNVSVGDVIAQLNTDDLNSQLAEAKANVDAQQALLDKLIAGSTPQDIAVSQTALNSAKQTLQNYYMNISSVIFGAYTSANDAIRNQLSSFFINPETNNPQLTFQTSNSQDINNLINSRIKASTELNIWQNEEQILISTTQTSTLETMLQNSLNHLYVLKLTSTLALTTIINSTNLSDSQQQALKTQVTNSLNEINTAIQNINTTIQNIASQKNTILQAQADLNLKMAGSTQQDIDAQKAVVEQAQASVDSLNVKIANSSMISPINGTITVQNAKVGETVIIGAPMVSIIATKDLEVDALIAEADIGKVKIGDSVSMTLDAFRGKTFTGKVTYINPGENIVEGVPMYKTVFHFSKLDSGVKTGMTANLDITTNVQNDALYLPQRVVILDADGNYTVQLYKGDKQAPETKIINVGIRDQNGNIQILSGLNENDSIISPTQ